MESLCKTKRRDEGISSSILKTNKEREKLWNKNFKDSMEKSTCVCTYTLHDDYYGSDTS